MRRLALPALLLAAVAGGCRSQERVEARAPEALREGAQQLLVGVDHYVSREGVRRAHLQADTAVFLGEGDSVQLKKVRVTFYRSDGSVLSTLTSRAGTYDMRSGDMLASGNVIVRDTARAQRLETQRLTYAADSDRLRSDQPFVQYRGDDVIRGTGFVTDPSLDQIRVAHPSLVSPGPGGEVAGPADTTGAKAAGGQPGLVREKIERLKERRKGGGDTTSGDGP